MFKQVGMLARCFLIERCIGVSDDRQGSWSFLVSDETSLL
jgi:hypothetical protein